MRNFFRLSILLGIFTVTPALAQGTAQQRTACTDDAYRLCEAQIPVVEEVAACLRAHIGSLSAGCRYELAKGAVKAKRRARRHH